ncbi:hypothetical protein ACLMJK_007953, partial [Lecanora helva]
MALWSHNNDDEQEPFFSKDETEMCSDNLKQHSGKSIWIYFSVAIFTIIAHGSLVLFWTAPWTSPDSVSRNLQSTQGLYSPFYGVINKKIETWPEDAWDESQYVGTPSREIDTAWDKLQAVEGISVTPEEAAKVNLTSKIKLKSGDQAVVVGYFHNLHCI